MTHHAPTVVLVNCSMQPDALALAREWLARADEDLAVAERLLQTPPALLTPAASHSQQACEKALKAFLAAHNVAFHPKSSLEELLSLCQAIDAGFAQLTLAAMTLGRYRYPPCPPAPTSGEAEEALQLADDAVRFVRARLGL